MIAVIFKCRKDRREKEKKEIQRLSGGRFTFSKSDTLFAGMFDRC